MSVDSILDDAFSLLLRKAQAAEVTQALRPATINFMWTGSGAPLVLNAMDPILVEVPFPSRLVWVHMYAGDALGKPVEVTTSVQLQLTDATSFGAFTLLSGTGLAPALTGGYFLDADLTNWVMNLTTGDTIVAVPQAFVGSATWLALTIQLRPTEQAIGISDVTDNAGGLMTFSDGSPVDFRSAI